jgi:hypothetical protein
MARFSGGKGNENKMCFSVLSTTSSAIFLSLRRIQLDTVINVQYMSPYNVPAVLVRFRSNLNFLDRFYGKCSNMKFHENPSAGSPVVPCGYTDGRTDMTKLIAAFRNFANALKDTRFEVLTAVNLRIQS